MNYGKTYIFEELESTNDYLKSNIESLNNGDIVLAYSQSKGRGRLNNVWLSEKGNLYFSLFIKESLDRNEIFPIVMRAAVAVKNLLENDYDIEATIKYPNDILVGGKKICGILAETIGYETIDAVILGVGINVNQIDFPNLNGKATSIKLVSGNATDIKSVLKGFLNEFACLDETNVHEQYHNGLYFPEKSFSLDGIDYRISYIKNNGQVVIIDGITAKTVDYTDLFTNI